MITPAPRNPVADKAPGRFPTLRESIPSINSSLSMSVVGELTVVVGVGGIAVKKG